MDGDLKRLTYCMKDVYNWKEWLDMNREYKEVDYTNVIEYVEIATVGNAVDFGDLTVTRQYGAGCSNGHGGL